MTENKQKTIRKLSLIFIAVVVVSMLAFAGAGAAGSGVITYDINGGTGTAPIDTTKYEDDDYLIVQTPGDMTSLKKDGYQFVGWNTNTTGTGTNYMPGERVRKGDIGSTLYAQWGQVIPVYSASDLSTVYSKSVGSSVTIKDKDGNDVSFTCAKYDCVRVMGDFELSSLSKGRDSVLDLNGHSLIFSSNVFSGSGKLTVMDSNPSGDGTPTEGYLDKYDVWNLGHKASYETGEEQCDIAGGLIQTSISNKAVVWDMRSSCNFVLEGGTIAGIHASGSGGLFRVESGSTLTIAGGKIFGNSTSDGGGGTVVNLISSTFIMSGGELANNVLYATEDKDWTGGACIRVDGYNGSNNIYIYGGKIKNNSVRNSNDKTLDTFGGGIFIWGESSGNQTVIIQGNVEITGNQANKGGAIAMYGSKGYSPMFSGKLKLEIKPDSNGKVPIITNNYAKDSGGFLFMNKNPNASGTLDTIISGGTLGGPLPEKTNELSGNEAGNYGGGIYQACDTLTLSGNTEILTNTAKSGGGIYLANGTMTVGGKTIITKNKASSDGAGVYVGNGKMTIDENTVIKLNEAAQNGGGVYMKDGTMIIEGSAIIGGIFDNVESGNSAGVSGGGIYLEASTPATSTMTIGGSANITYNTAVTSGGGVYQANGTMTIQDNSLISNNKVTAGDGGGIYLANGNISVLGKSRIISNEVSEDGAGVYVGNGEMRIEDSVSIGSNKAKNGGGVYMDQGTMTITGGTSGSDTDSVTISSNEVTNDGAGVYVGNGTMSLSGRTNILTNKAANGGGIYLLGQELTLSGSTNITTNEATNGGGVYVGDGTMTVGGTSEIMNNSATDYGGGVYQAAGTLTVKDNVILGSSNTADIYGGGVYLANGDMILKDNVTVKENEAKYKGGGIYMKLGSLTMSNKVFITKNTLSEPTSSTDPHAAAGEVTSIVGSGFYIGTPNAVILKDNARFGGKDELFINSLEKCKDGSENLIGIQTYNWTGDVSLLGLNQSKFASINTRVFTTVQYEKGKTDAASVAKRARLSDEEKWTLKNIYDLDLPTEVERIDEVYAVLNHPRVASTNFMKVVYDKDNPGQGTARVSFVLSEDNSSDWYKVRIYYSENEPASESDWTELTLPCVTRGAAGTGEWSRMYDPTTGEKTTIERGMYYDNEKYMTFKFDGTEGRVLQDGYYGLQIEVGKDIIDPTTGKSTQIINALYYEITMPVVEKQPDYFYGYLEGESVNPITIEAFDWQLGNQITYQWEYSTNGKDWQNIDDKIPGFPGANTASIYPTEDGLAPDPENPDQGKVMEGYYRCLITDATTTTSNDANKKSSTYSNTAQITLEYRIFYYNGGMELPLEPHKYDKFTKVILPEDVQIDGLIFMGWYKDPDFTEEITLIQSGNKGAQKIYGKFILIPFFLKLDVNGKGTWNDGGKEIRGGQDKDPELFVNVGTTSLPKIAEEYYVPQSYGPRASVTTFEGWSVGPERYSPVVINPDGTVVPDVVVGDTRYTTENGEWLYAPDKQKSVDITLYANWKWPDPVVYLQSLGGQPIELNKVKVEVTNDAGDKFVYKSPKNDPSVGEFLEAGEKLNLAYGVDPINGYFPEYDGWGIGHGEKVRVHVIYNNEHTIYDQEVMTI